MLLFRLRSGLFQEIDRNETHGQKDDRNNQCRIYFEGVSDANSERTHDCAYFGHSLDEPKAGRLHVLREGLYNKVRVNAVQYN